MSASRKEKVFATLLPNNGKIEIIAKRIPLSVINRWEQMPQPPPGALYWTLRNEHAANFLNVTYEPQAPAANPDFYSITPLNGNRDFVRETWIPPAIWVRAPDGVPHNIYFEYAVSLEEGTDAYRDLSGGLPG